MSEERITTENRMDMVVQAFLDHTSVNDVSKATGVSRSSIYYMMRKPEFHSKLSDARKRAMERAISFMQANLNECAEILMKIIKDENTPAQTRIYAINTLLQSCKGFSEDNSTLAGMAVTIVDSI